MTDKMLREKIANGYYHFTVKQGWELAGFERDIRTKSYEYADQILAIVADSIKVRREYAFRQAGLGSREHRLRGQAQVNAYDLILGDLK